VYDTYAQFDRATNKEFATRLDLKFFIYSGGLIETSRKFCMKRDGKLFSTKEAERTFSKDPTLPRTVSERGSGALIGYNAVIDMGRWNCRHLARYVSKEMAMELDPNVLKKAIDARKIIGV